MEGLPWSRSSACFVFRNLSASLSPMVATSIRRTYISHVNRILLNCFDSSFVLVEAGFEVSRECLQGGKHHADFCRHGLCPSLSGALASTQLLHG